MRVNEKRFAAGADRGLIALCEKAGIDLSQFVEMALKAMQKIASDLGF